jgi:hypothetical protein
VRAWFLAFGEGKNVKKFGFLGEITCKNPKIWGHFENLCKNSKIWGHWVREAFGESQKWKIWGLWVRNVKNMGSLGESDAEKGGLNSPTYASHLKWECPPPGFLYYQSMGGILWYYHACYAVQLRLRWSGNWQHCYRPLLPLTRTHTMLGTLFESCN